MHLIGLSLSNMKNLWSETFKCDNIPKKLKSGSGKILLMVLYFYPKINMIPNSWSKRPRKRTQPQEGWGKKIKEKMMDDALMVGAAMSRLLIQEVKSVSLWFPWGSSTWELQLPAARIQRAEDSKASEYVTFYNKTVRHRAQRWQNKDVLSIISSTQYKELKERLHSEGRRWRNVRRSLAQRKKWEVETGAR